MKFGGYLECGGLMYPSTPRNLTEVEKLYSVHPYYYDPIHLIYRTPPLECLFHGKAFFIEDLYKSVPAEKKFHDFVSEERSEPLLNDIVGKTEEELKSQFYLFKVSHKSLNQAFSSFTFNFEDLYFYRRDLQAFLPKDIREQFDQIWGQGACHSDIYSCR